MGRGPEFPENSYKSSQSPEDMFASYCKNICFTFKVRLSVV